MKTGVFSFIAGPIAVVSSGDGASNNTPIRAPGPSQVAPAANPVHVHRGIGGYQGAVYLNGRWIMNFREGNYQGYASNWWHRGKEEDKPGRGTIVVFKNESPSAAWRVPDAMPLQQLLTVGLGAPCITETTGAMGLIALPRVWIPGKEMPAISTAGSDANQIACRHDLQSARLITAMPHLLALTCPGFWLCSTSRDPFPPI